MRRATASRPSNASMARTFSFSTATPLLGQESKGSVSWVWKAKRKDERVRRSWSASFLGGENPGASRPTVLRVVLRKRHPLFQCRSARFPTHSRIHRSFIDRHSYANVFYFLRSLSNPSSPASLVGLVALFQIRCRPSIALRPRLIPRIRSTIVLRGLRSNLRCDMARVSAAVRDWWKSWMGGG